MIIDHAGPGRCSQNESEAVGPGRGSFHGI